VNSCGFGILRKGDDGFLADVVVLIPLCVVICKSRGPFALGFWKEV